MKARVKQHLRTLIPTRFKTLYILFGPNAPELNFLQNSISVNKEHLKRFHSLHYASSGLTKVSAAGSQHSDIANEITLKAAVPQKILQLKEEVRRSSCSKFLISAQAFFNFSSQDIADLKNAMPNLSVKIIFYLRRQDLALESEFLEHVWSAAEPVTADTYLQNESSRFAYYEKVRNWSQAFGKENVVVSSLDATITDITSAFLSKLKIRLKAGEKLTTPRKLEISNNETPVNLIQKIKHLPTEETQRGKAIARLASLDFKSSRKVSLFSPEERLAFLERFKDDNQLLAEDFGCDLNQSASSKHLLIPDYKTDFSAGLPPTALKEYLKLKLTGLVLTEQKNHYQFTEGDTTYIVIKRHFLKPELKTKYGIITTRHVVAGKLIVFIVKVDDLAVLDGPSAKVYVQNNGKGPKRYLTTEIKDRVKQYSTTKFARTYNNHIYFFRSAASKKENLIVQKKKVEYFETDRFFTLSKLGKEKYSEKSAKYVLFFEKHMKRYEESASRLFEKVYHYPNVFFVLSKEANNYEEIKARFGDKIVSPDEERYVEMLYRSSYLVGTEVPMHLISLRSSNQYLREELCNYEKHRFIFLQHGVMFALSLNSVSRNFFRKDFIQPPYRVVVSSQLEAAHFLRFGGGYEPQDLWKTGLATFDNKKINADANKTVIMLTWRPWDENKESLQDTTYYKAVEQIFNSIRDRASLQIVWHPKVDGDLEENHLMAPYFYKGDINSLLNETKVLITDYSSVSFDAFYRGANVIFWWKEKEYCLKKYKNQLMLNEENIFGDIAYCNDSIEALIEDNQGDQKDRYKDNYRKIVEFSDDNNTQRIVEKLIEEKVI